jgi:hypothetical protein
MAGAQVRPVRDQEGFEVLGHGRFGYDGAAELGGPIATLGPASVASLRRAVWSATTRMWGEDHDPVGIWVTDTPPEDFDEDYSPASPIAFEVGPREFLVEVTAFVWDPTLDEREVAKIVRPLLSRRRCRLVEVDVEGSPTQTWWRVRFAPPVRGRTVAEAYQYGGDVLALLEAVEGGGLSPPSCADLIRGGRADLLIGVRESSWLEAKSVTYPLSSQEEKIRLAQDVAKFANAEEGGLLVVGLRTRKGPQGDVIRGVSPIPLSRLNVRRYRAVIDRRVFPPVEGLQVEVVEMDPDSGMLLVTVPPQPDELKPFLVHGAIVGDRADGASISIVRRRGEDSIPVTAPGIHAMLAAGKGVMRRKTHRTGRRRKKN